MSFVVFWPCPGNAAVCAPRIMAAGVIDRDTPARFAAFLNGARRAGGFLPPTATVCFDSPGGDLQGGLELGRAIRKLGFGTCLAPAYFRVTSLAAGTDEVFARDVICASACAFAFAGGVTREVEPNSKYGVHQFFGARAPIGDSSTQITMVALAQYLEEMGVSRALLDLASLVRPQSMRWLTPEEMRQLHVDNMTAITSKWQAEALKDGTVLATIEQIKPGMQSRVFLAIGKNNNQPTLLIGFTPRNSGFSALQDAHRALNETALSVRVDGRVLISSTSVTWSIGRDSVIAHVSMTESASRAIRTGGVLRVDASLPTAFRDFDPSIEVSLEGAGGAIAAALR